MEELTVQLQHERDGSGECFRPESFDSLSRFGFVFRGQVRVRPVVRGRVQHRRHNSRRRKGCSATTQIGGQRCLRRGFSCTRQNRLDGEAPKDSDPGGKERGKLRSARRKVSFDLCNQPVISQRFKLADAEHRVHFSRHSHAQSQRERWANHRYSSRHNQSVEQTFVSDSG